MTSVERENERLKDKVYDLTAEFKGLLSLKKENEALSKRYQKDCWEITNF